MAPLMKKNTEDETNTEPTSPEHEVADWVQVEEEGDIAMKDNTPGEEAVKDKDELKRATLSRTWTLRLTLRWIGSPTLWWASP